MTLPYPLRASEAGNTLDALGAWKVERNVLRLSMDEGSNLTLEYTTALPATRPKNR